MEPTIQSATNTPRVGELISILQEQKKIYEDLLDLSRQKQKILIKGDISALEGITAQEEVLVFQTGKLEEKREQCLSSLAEAYGWVQEKTLADFLPLVSTEKRVELEKIHEDFSMCLNDLRRLNHENTELLEQSLQFVNFTVDVLSRQSKPVYNAAQEVKVENLKNFLDKKV